LTGDVRHLHMFAPLCAACAGTEWWRKILSETRKARANAGLLDGKICFVLSSRCEESFVELLAEGYGAELLFFDDLVADL
jgi:hypothetical protein